MRARDRMWFYQFRSGKRDEPVRILFARFDPREDRCGGQEFEGAAHQETIIGTPRHRTVVCGIEREDAEPPSRLALNCL